MPAVRLRDAQIVAALQRRFHQADATTLSNLAWFAARRGEAQAALAAARAATALPDAPRAAWRALERLASGQVDGMLLTPIDGAAADLLPAGNPLVAAIAAHRQQELAAAEACYRAALPHADLAPAAWNGLGVLHEQQQERAAADRAWEQAVALGSMAAVHNRALAMLRRGFPHRARAVLAPSLARRDAPVHLRFLGGYAALADQDAEAALALLGAVLVDDPESARAHFTLGLACERLGHHVDALAAIRRALLLSPWYVPLAWVLERCGSAGEGVVEVAVSPEESGASAVADDALLSLGRSLLQTAHLGEALAVFDQVLTHQPAQAAALFHRGVVLAKLRRYEEALEDWEVAGEADPAGEVGEASRRHARSARQLANLFSGR